MPALSLISAVLALLKALAPVAALIGIGIWGQRQKATGGQLEAARVTQATAAAETAIAAAEVAAPSTRLAVIDQLNQGGF